MFSACVNVRTRVFVLDFYWARARFLCVWGAETRNWWGTCVHVHFFGRALLDTRGHTNPHCCASRFGVCHCGNVQNTFGVAKSRASILAERCSHRWRRVVVVGGTSGNSTGSGAGGGNTIRRARSLRHDNVWISSFPHHFDIFGTEQKMCLRRPRSGLEDAVQGGRSREESKMSVLFAIFWSVFCFFLSSRGTSVVSNRMRTTQNLEVGYEEGDLIGSFGARGKPESNRIQIQVRLVIFSKVKNHKLLL